MTHLAHAAVFPEGRRCGRSVPSTGSTPEQSLSARVAAVWSGGMFDGFETSSIDVNETEIFIRRKGSGRPLLLLHGFPETHLMWHGIAPALAEDFTVVCADLRGYGASGKPPSAPDHAPYAKSAMGRDMIRMMEAQGFRRFSVAGHDRGGRVAYRMTLDHADRIERLALLDIIPTGEALARADVRLALGYWPWVLLAQPEPLPERLITAAPEIIVDNALGGWGSDKASFPAQLRSAYIDALRDDATVHAICEEYRAAATIDFARDSEDRRADRRISCPVLALWGKGGPLDTWYEDAGGPLGIWRDWAGKVTGRAIAGGHFFPEQNARETISELRSFFRA
jgi:haloacetate dehalogenase